MSENHPISAMVNNLEMCRLCLNLTGNKINIFTDDFPKMLEILTGLKVAKEDNLPKISCLKCAYEVKSAIIIRRKIIKSHKALVTKKVISEISSQQENDDFNDNNDSEGENSPLKTLETIQKITNLEEKAEAIQKLKLATNSLYLRKLKSLNLKESFPLETPVTSFSDVLIKKESDKDSLSFSPQNTTNPDISLPSRHLPPRIAKKERVFEHLPSQKFTSKRMLMRERQKIMRKEITKMMENKKKFKIDVEQLEVEVQLEEKAVGISNKPSKTYYCAECKIKFPIAVQYRRHMTRHVHTKCHICHKVVQKYYFKKHMVIHNGETAICEICGFASKNSGSIRMHYATHHRGPKPLCDECGKEFLTKGKLAHHIKKYHRDERDFKCEICGKAFHMKTYLDNHISARHMKIRPHVCEFCGKGFSGRDGLKTHRRQHTNEAPYECHLCRDRFRQKVSLRGHLKTKHGMEEEDSFVCKICGKGYMNEMALEIHTRIHNEVKCPNCPDTFANEQYLGLHMASVHHSKQDEEDGQTDQSTMHVENVGNLWTPHANF